MAAKTKKQTYFYALGRRKTSSARVRLFEGKGDNLVNNLPTLKYFRAWCLKPDWRSF